MYRKADYYTEGDTMNTLNLTLCAAAGTAFLAAMPAVQAQITLPSRTVLLPTTGTKEINLAGSLFLDGSKPYSLSGTYGRFITPNIEFGGTGSVAGANHSKTVTTLGAFGDYYFRGGADANNPLIPYVGLFAGYSHKEDSALSGGAQAGVKYFLNPNVALTAEYQYRSTRRGNGTNQVIFGFSTFFR